MAEIVSKTRQVEQSLTRLNAALGKLEAAVAQTVAAPGPGALAEPAIPHADPSFAAPDKMARERDAALAQIDRLETRIKTMSDVNRDVSRRLVTAMERLRAMRDSQDLQAR